MAGCMQLLRLGWLHLTYIPSLIVLSVLYGPEIIIPLGFLVPALEVRHFVRGIVAEEALISGSAILSGTLVSLVISRMRGERDRIKGSLDSLKEEAEYIDVNTPADTISNEGLASQHLSALNEANAEIREVLLLAKHVVSAEAANMFIFRDNSLHLRCSSEPQQQANLPFDELAASCIRKKQLVLLNDMTLDKRESFPSHIAAPLMDGNFVSGMLTVHSRTSGAFKEDDGKAVEMFAGQIASILKRHRIHSQLRKEHLMLKKLKEGGSRLIASLKTDDIAGSLIEAVYSIAPQERVSIALFAPKGDKFEIVRQIGFHLSEGNIFDFSNTRIGLVSSNREPDYISDLRNERSPIFPFKINSGGSVFMLPLSYEKELLGIVVFLSPAIDAIRPYQIELLKVLGNQAASSLANAKFYAEIERMAITDGLTGLFNHRNFQERLAAEFKRLRRFPEPLSLLLIDIDFFKKINDHYGHPAGDEVLRGVASVIKETARNLDVPARYGGEEFSAILPGTNHEGALKMAERLRKSVEDKRFDLDGKVLGVSVSIGAATAPYDAESKEELIEKADQALYHAKGNGRNRCILWRDIK